MKKHLSFWLSVVILFSLLSVLPIVTHATEPKAVWNGSLQQPSNLIIVDGVYYYEISSGAELAYIAQTGGDWLKYNYILANDIVLNSTELTYDANGNLTVDASLLNKWTPISGFKGIFNGNNFSVSGLYVNTESDAGLLSIDKGSLCNLTVKNAYVKGNTDVGGICGSFSTSNGGCIENCYYYGAVIGVDRVGGLVGNHRNGGIFNCGNYGNIWATGSSAGGIAGNANGLSEITNCFNEGAVFSTGSGAGGITGIGGRLDLCANSGNITGRDFVAGICGVSYGYYWLWDCINTGNITGNNYVAGICGSCESPLSDLFGCGNSGNISGAEYVGGLVGSVPNGITASIAAGYNTGDISGTDYVGGIIGYGDGGSSIELDDLYNAGKVTGNSNVGGIAGYSDTAWGNNSTKKCYYLQTNTVNTSLNGFGNTNGIMEAVVEAKGLDFFCIKEDKTLNLSGHTYSAVCDATCDLCGFAREVIHSFTNQNYDASLHWYECQCGEIKPDSKTPHSGGTATCTEKAICNTCQQGYGNADPTNHNSLDFAYQSNQNGTHQKRHACCQAIVTESDACSGGAATCYAKAKCDFCEDSYGELTEHRFSTDWSVNATQHWHKCTCGKTVDEAEHTFGKNSICDVCTYQAPNAGLSGGCGSAMNTTPIVLLAVASCCLVAVEKRAKSKKK